MKNNKFEITRRALLTSMGITAGVYLSKGPSLLPSFSAGFDYSKLSQGDALRLLDESLSDAQRQATFLPWDHPSRQLTNTINIHKGPHIATLFDANQTALIKQLYTGQLSDTGEQLFKNTISLEGKFSAASFKIYTDEPRSELSKGRHQMMFNGGHFMLRSTPQEQSNFVFGGPISYGQQIGNGRFKVQGNAFKAHGDAIDDLHAALNASERQRAYVSGAPPMELSTQVLGPTANFPGIRIGDLSSPVKAQAQESLAAIFSAYPATQREDAFQAIAENGGVDNLHLALYSDYCFYRSGEVYSQLTAQERLRLGRPYAQVWRIEGPASVIHFQGYPHVHAYINVVRDPYATAIGEQLAFRQEPMSQVQIKHLIESAMLRHSSASFAYYPQLSLTRLSPGAISTGSIYSLEPFDNQIVTVDVEQNQMTPDMLASAQRQGFMLESGKVYRIATTAYSLERTDILGGNYQAIEKTGSVRNALIDYLKKNGLGAFSQA